MKPVGRRALGWAAIVSLGLVLLIGLPQFVRMPFYCDTTHWDIGAQPKASRTATCTQTIPGKFISAVSR